MKHVKRDAAILSLCHWKHTTGIVCGNCVTLSRGFDAGEAFGRADGIEEFVRRVEKMSYGISLATNVIDIMRSVAKEMLKEAKGDEHSNS